MPFPLISAGIPLAANRQLKTLADERDAEAKAVKADVNRELDKQETQAREQFEADLKAQKATAWTEYVNSTQQTSRTEFENQWVSSEASARTSFESELKGERAKFLNKTMKDWEAASRTQFEARAAEAERAYSREFSLRYRVQASPQIMRAFMGDIRGQFESELTMARSEVFGKASASAEQWQMEQRGMFDTGLAAQKQGASAKFESNLQSALLGDVKSTFESEWTVQEQGAKETFNKDIAAQRAKASETYMKEWNASYTVPSLTERILSWKPPTSGFMSGFMSEALGLSKVPVGKLGVEDTRVAGVKVVAGVVAAGEMPLTLIQHVLGNRQQRFPPMPSVNEPYYLGGYLVGEVGLTVLSYGVGSILSEVGREAGRKIGGFIESKTHIVQRIRSSDTFNIWKTSEADAEENAFANIESGVMDTKSSVLGDAADWLSSKSRRFRDWRGRGVSSGEVAIPLPTSKPSGGWNTKSVFGEMFEMDAGFEKDVVVSPQKAWTERAYAEYAKNFPTARLGGFGDKATVGKAWTDAAYESNFRKNIKSADVLGGLKEIREGVLSFDSGGDTGFNMKLMEDTKTPPKIAQYPLFFKGMEAEKAAVDFSEIKHTSAINPNALNALDVPFGIRAYNPRMVPALDVTLNLGRLGSGLWGKTGGLFGVAATIGVSLASLNRTVTKERIGNVGLFDVKSAVLQDVRVESVTGQAGALKLGQVGALKTAQLTMQASPTLGFSLASPILDRPRIMEEQRPKREQKTRIRKKGIGHVLYVNLVPSESKVYGYVFGKTKIRKTKNR